MMRSIDHFFLPLDYIISRNLIMVPSSNIIDKFYFFHCTLSLKELKAMGMRGVPSSPTILRQQYEN